MKMKSKRILRQYVYVWTVCCVGTNSRASCTCSACQ